MKRKQLLPILLAIIMLMVLPADATTLTKTQKQVKSAVANLMKYCKQYNVAKIKNTCVDPSSQSGLFEKKVYTAKFIRKVNKKNLKYKLKSISVKGKTAKAKVRISFLDHTNLFESIFEESIKYVLEHPDFTSEELDKYVYERMTYNAKKYFVTYMGDDKAVTLTLSFKKTGGKWKLVSIPKKFINAIHCNYNDAYDHYDWDQWTY